MNDAPPLDETPEHKTIWLQPWCDKCSRCGEDRNWCEDDVWVACEECGKPSVKYVLADVKVTRHLDFGD